MPPAPIWEQISYRPILLRAGNDNASIRGSFGALNEARIVAQPVQRTKVVTSFLRTSTSSALKNQYNAKNAEIRKQRRVLKQVRAVRDRAAGA
jgi:hypothetical protein